MRRLLCLFLPAALLLSACGADEPEAGDLSAVTVEQAEEGANPALTVPTPFSVESSTSRVVTEGDGEATAEGDLVSARYLVVNGRTGQQVGPASDWAQAPTTLSIDETILPPLQTGLADQPVGSRVLVAVAPADGVAASIAQQEESGVAAEDTLLFLMDIVDVVPQRAEGQAVTPPAGLPSVALAEDGAPTITIPAETEPPTELVVQPLITGTGPVVEAGQTITAQYTGVTWDDGAVFDSSWQRGSPVPFPIGQGGVIEGWDVGLVGQPVGSQVLLVVPPAQGYGEGGQPDAGIEGTDTLVFVVDILTAG